MIYNSICIFLNTKYFANIKLCLKQSNSKYFSLIFG